MKKMLFSAIALVAFTATSMAGEIEETKVVSEIKTDSKNIVFVHPVRVMSYCEGLYLRIKEMVMEDLNNEDLAASIAFVARKECLEHSSNPNN
jgi:hypothetical protein